MGVKGLRTVPPFATVHTFCTSRDGVRNLDFLRVVPSTNSRVFCTVYDYAGKDPRKGN